MMKASIGMAKTTMKEVTEKVDGHVKCLAEHAGLTITKGADGKMEVRKATLRLEETQSKKRKHAEQPQGVARKLLEGEDEEMTLEEEVQVVQQAVMGMQEEAVRGEEVEKTQTSKKKKGKGKGSGESERREGGEQSSDELGTPPTSDGGGAVII